MEKGTVVKRISASSLGTFLCCPLKYKFRMVDEIEVPIPMPQHLIYGGAVHKAIEQFHKGLYSETPLSLKDMQNIFVSHWEWELEYLEEVNWYSGVQESQMVKAALASIKAYHAAHQDDPPPMPYIGMDGKEGPAVEAKFLLSLTPLLGEGYDDWHLSGIIDLIDNREELDIIDHKTSSMKYSEFKVKTNLQLPLYSWAFRNLVNLGNFPTLKPGTVEDHVVFDVLLKKRPIMIPQKRKINEATYKHVAHILKTVIGQLERKEFTPNYGSECSAFGGCEFAAHCMDFRFE